MQELIPDTYNPKKREDSEEVQCNGHCKLVCIYENDFVQILKCIYCMRDSVGYKFDVDAILSRFLQEEKTDDDDN